MGLTWTTPTTVANGDTPDEDYFNDQVKGNLEYLHGNMPARCTLWHEEAAVVAGNVISVSQNASQNYNHYAQQSTAADADSFSGSAVLIAGTYSLLVLGIQLTSGGLLDWTLDGASIATGQDWYSGGTVYNVYQTISGITVTGNQRHILIGTVNGQNASSSGYDIRLTKYAFIPASD